MSLYLKGDLNPDQRAWLTERQITPEWVSRVRAHPDGVVEVDIRTPALRADALFIDPNHPFPHQHGIYVRDEEPICLS